MNKGQLIKIRESLSQPQRQLIIIGSCALLFIIISIFVYRPLGIKIQDADRRLNTLTAQLASQRDKVSALKKLGLKRRLMQQKDVSLAIDEITKKGRVLDLKFISITPAKLQKSTQAGFKELPINFEIESGYQSLGKFLTYLEEFPLTIIQIKGLTIRPREETLPNLDVELLLNLYMEAEDGKE